MQFLKLTLLVIALSFMSGCTIQTFLILYNNTERKIEIEFIPKSPKMKIEKFTIEKGEYIKVLFHPKAKIQYKEKIETYNLNWPPKKYLCSVINGSAIFCQIENDGKIYILKNDNFPVKEFPEQPEGFPLTPTQQNKKTDKD